MKLYLTILAVSLPCVALSGDLKPGTNLVKLKHDGHLREMLVRLPDQYDQSIKYPVIFGFHGAGGPKEGYHRQLERTVRKHDFISVSPQGTSNNRGITGWNGFARHRISNTDDVGMVLKSIDYLDKNASIDRSRLYATGGSSGAIFCFRLAMETNSFAAIAPMRGAMIKRPPAPKGRPRISILLVCGAEDALFKGGEQVRGEVFYSAHEAMSAWAKNHGDKATLRTQPLSKDTTLTHFSPKEASHELTLYAIKGSGHRLSREQMAQAIEYMGAFFLRNTKSAKLKKSSPPSVKPDALSAEPTGTP